ncbi:fasciclin domain-containing protein [Flavobacteriaceae bacterium TP-CH-4]|uniref:Fasciclin domain-containing protein n=1 Tax=Pelagihabitans pacificus TaxID=2696054 RepID=A0A967ARB0_9FLAO|nr:fasciclin domain-containing protein [Pelagihabitans pacificus]NHF58055.1 fasciclin domain-containing protein [Pelagihabitans pacificus]
MKKYLNFPNVLVMVLVLVFTASCDLDDDTPPTIPIPDTNIVEIAQSNPDLSTLVAALERADLVSTLQGTTLYTVLAPTNTAFDNFLGEAGFASLDEVPVATLQQLLLNHVILERIESALLVSLQRNYLQTLADGPGTDTNLAMYFDATNGVQFNGGATVTTADVVASNGIIHIVDEVIGLPTLATFVSVDDTFRELDTAIDVVSPNTDLDEELDTATGPFTLFIPSNTAFEILLNSNPDWNSSSDIPEDLLLSVLAHHVVPGNIRSTSISDGQTVTTLEGDEIEFLSVAGSLEITDGSGTAGTRIPVTDIQTSNGVIHVIDAVLIPNTEN